MNVATTTIGDFLASFCLVEEGDVRLDLPRAIALTAHLKDRLRYFEVIYVVNESARDAIAAAAQQLAKAPNLRVIIINSGHSFYRRRLIAASEAIGDVVVLTSFEELDAIDVATLAGSAHVRERVIMARRAGGRGAFALFHHLLTLSSTYRVDPNDMRTIALPRGRLESLLARPTATLDLRFEPRRGGDYERQAVDFPSASRRRRRVVERQELAAELVANSAPRFLKGYAALAVVVAMGAIGYAVYALGVVAFVPDVQPGWFSTSIVQAGSTAFIAGGVAIISLGVAEIYERLQGRARWTIVDEVANTNYFDRTQPLNVDIETETAAA